jgi:hypothetical protein
VLGHVRVDAGGDLVVDRAELLDGDPGERLSVQLM